MQRELARERAFPTIGIILLGGLTDDIKRFPRHTSSGITYTSVEGDIFTETSIVESEDRIGQLDGKKVNDGYRSPFRILEKYHEVFERYLESHDNKIGFVSENSKILSGSSDSGAAALGAAIESLSPNTLDEVELENNLRTISESVGRSLKGGLTLTEIIDGIPVTQQLLPAEKFSGLTVVGCRFPEKRKPSDVIHSNIVTSPRYEQRIESTLKKGNFLKELAKKADIEGIFELAHRDTEEYHALIESVGVRIINADMRKFMNHVNDLRKEIWCTYIVTGGTNVFVVVHNKDSERISEEAKKFNSSPVLLKITGAPVNLFRLPQ